MGRFGEYSVIIIIKYYEGETGLTSNGTHLRKLVWSRMLEQKKQLITVGKQVTHGFLAGLPPSLRRGGLGYSLSMQMLGGWASCPATC